MYADMLDKFIEPLIVELDNQMIIIILIKVLKEDLILDFQIYRDFFLWGHLKS